jgi:eukaryotic-like serine/threonine-protein kinase
MTAGPLDRLTAALADRYRIERELGAGGMATVYLAHDLKHDRKVAIKVLRPELSAALGAERFLREIATTASLRHPHILPLFDSGATHPRHSERSEESGRSPASHSDPERREGEGSGRIGAELLYYVMPYVEGESLRDRLDREKQLPIEDALQIAREVADALSYAHAHGVIHRDIKPENILLESGHAVVADFGIARAINAAAGGEQLTETGMAVGTVRYMSPEQAAGERDLDGRSDLYALACVLYEMLAGQAPFTGPTIESIIHQHLTATPPPITQLRPAVPPEVAAALQRALAKTPADRFNPVAQFAGALRPVVPAAAAPAPSRTSRALLAAAALVALSALGFLLLRDRGTPAAALPTVGRTTQVTRDEGLEVDPALSPDGESIAYAAGPADAMQLYVRQVNGGRAVALTSDTTHNYRWPRWSPDGSQIAYQSDDGIYLVPPLGGAPRRAARIPAGARFSSAWGTPIAGFDWSPDGARIAWTRGYNGEGVTILTLATGDTVTLPAPSSPFAPAWSPDGRSIAVVAGNSVFVFGTGYFANAGAAELWLVHMDGSPPTRITDDHALNLAPHWSPDGRTLYWISDRDGSRDVYAHRIGRDGAPEGAPQRVTTGADAQGLSLSRQGARMAYSRLNSWSAIWSLPVPARGPVSARNATRVTTGNETIESVVVSRDGRWLAFDSDRSGNFDIWVQPVGGGEARQVTSDPAPDFSPSWSPDGSRLVFHSLRSGNRDVFTVDADGTNLVQRTSSPAEELDAGWAPDGSAIVFAVLGSDVSTQGMATLRLEPGAQPEFTAIGTSDYFRWSPDGSSILYHAADGFRLRRLDGGGDHLLVPTAADGAEGFYATWSPDGATMYYLTRQPEGWAIRSMPAAGGTSRVIVEFDDPGMQHTRFGLTTDGKRLYFTVGSPASDIWVADLAAP